MKHLLSYSLLVFLIFTTHLVAQKSYTVDGTSIELKTEIEGPLTLLWNITDGNYRYFVKNGATVNELKNTKVDGDYQEEYKAELQKQASDTSLEVSKLKFTKASLSSFFNNYNKSKDPNYVDTEKGIKLKTRLGAFVGVTNSVFSENPTNQTLPTMGVDFEIVDHNLLKRHSLVLRFKQTFESSDYKYSASQFSLNYRFKFIKKEKLAVFINTKIAGYNYDSRQVEVNEDNATPYLTTVSNGNFEALLNFGIGADYALGNGYLTFMYNDFVSVVQESNSEFPLDFSLGYKFNL
ncbi:MAG: hypothetical protein ACI93N_000289 [Flavobacteriaceae bacterium]|jgi:hypothetical protein